MVDQEKRSPHRGGILAWAMLAFYSCSSWTVSTQEMKWVLVSYFTITNTHLWRDVSQVKLFRWLRQWQPICPMMIMPWRPPSLWFPQLSFNKLVCCLIDFAHVNAITSGKKRLKLSRTTCLLFTSIMVGTSFLPYRISDLKMYDIQIVLQLMN